MEPLDYTFTGKDSSNTPIHLDDWSDSPDLPDHDDYTEEDIED